MSDYHRYARHGVREFRWTLWLILPTLALLGILSYACSWFSEAGSVARDEFGARRALSKYEWFRDKHEAITAVRAKAKAADADVVAFTGAAGPREKWTFEDKQESSRLSAVARATRNILAEMVAEYNANSKKFNHSSFRADDLPYTESED